MSGPTEPAGDRAPEPSRRTGVELAREALASARTEARRRGFLPGRQSPTAPADDRSGGPRRRRITVEQRSGAHPDERDPQQLGPTLDRLVAERGWTTDAAVGGVMGRWAAIVGPEVAAHAQPLTFDAGELVIVADSTAWATQIRLLAPTLLARLAEDLGAGVVTAVTVRGPSAPSWKKGLLAVRGRGPRDTYG
jgi:predicted nucleic acid-binding Zn ribbon protein